eukprot:13785182-Alexandrium_andersonii.AAC.1
MAVCRELVLKVESGDGSPGVWHVLHWHGLPSALACWFADRWSMFEWCRESGRVACALSVGGLRRGVEAVVAPWHGGRLAWIGASGRFLTVD